MLMTTKRLSRRHVLTSGSAIALGLAISRTMATQTPASGAVATPVPVSNTTDGIYVDARGTSITFEPGTSSIVSHVFAAGALAEFGATITGIFGPTKRSDGTVEAYMGAIDPATPNLGEETFTFDVEGYLGLGADAVIGVTYAVDDPTNVWSIEPEGVQQLQQTTSVGVVPVNFRPVPAVIGDYLAIAAAMGADVETAAIQSSRDTFITSSEALHAALAAKPGLTVLVMAANEERFYPVTPTPADLVYFAELGMTIVSAQGEDASGVSYERVLDYPADLILNETRAGWLTNDELASHPTFSQHPAVKAGQIGNRSNTYLASYSGLVPILDTLTTTISAAEVIL